MSNDSNDNETTIEYPTPWRHIAGDVNPFEYGGVFGRLTDADTIECYRVENKAELVGLREICDNEAPLWVSSEWFTREDLVEACERARDYLGMGDDDGPIDPTIDLFSLAFVVGYSETWNYHGIQCDDKWHAEIDVEILAVNTWIAEGALPSSCDDLRNAAYLEDFTFRKYVEQYNSNDHDRATLKAFTATVTAMLDDESYDGSPDIAALAAWAF
jgi:hypothetical protein